MKTIAVDQDWVLAKLNHKWLRVYNTIFNDNLTVEDVKDWDITKFVKPEAKDYMLNILNIHKFYRDLEVVEDSQRVLEQLSKTYNIIIATDPFTRMSFKSKYDWLCEHFPFIEPRNFIFTGNKGAIYADYLIDDGAHNLERFKGKGLLFDGPHNRHREEFFRVKGWNDIEKLFSCGYNVESIDQFYKKQGVEKNTK